MSEHGEGRIEADDVPVRRLAWVGVGLTVGVIAVVAATWVWFDHVVDQELQVKGYPRVERAP